jgi:hypothetical protein
MSERWIIRVDGGDPNFPVGYIIPWPDSNVPIPDGWLDSVGQGRKPDDLSELFAVIGYSWGGQGDVFQLPDMRKAARHE